MEWNADTFIRGFSFLTQLSENMTGTDNREGGDYLMRSGYNGAKIISRLKRPDSQSGCFKAIGLCIGSAIEWWYRSVPRASKF
jgi:hypothetical protein